MRKMKISTLFLFQIRKKQVLRLLKDLKITATFTSILLASLQKSAQTILSVPNKESSQERSLRINVSDFIIYKSQLMIKRNVKIFFFYCYIYGIFSNNWAVVLTKANVHLMFIYLAAYCILTNEPDWVRWVKLINFAFFAFSSPSWSVKNTIVENVSASRENMRNHIIYMHCGEWKIKRVLYILLRNFKFKLPIFTCLNPN